MLKEDVYYCGSSNIPLQLFQSPVAIVDGSTLLIWGWPIVSNGLEEAKTCLPGEFHLNQGGGARSLTPIL
mgnify:CR=1 FL=1